MWLLLHPGQSQSAFFPANVSLDAASSSRWTSVDDWAPRRFGIIVGVEWDPYAAAFTVTLPVRA